VGEPVKLEVVVAVDELVEAIECLVELHPAFGGMQQEHRYALQRHPGDDPQGAQADPAGGEQLRSGVGVGMDEFAAGGDEVEAHHGSGQSRMAGPGAVGAGRQGAGERLAVDVAEVRHRQPVTMQQVVEVMDRDAALDRDESAVRVDRDRPVECRHVESHSVGDGDRCEGVAGPDRLHPQAVRLRGPDRGGEVVDRLGPREPPGRRGLVAGPVAPGRWNDGVVSPHLPPGANSG
jgi:hypothetical protein